MRITWLTGCEMGRVSVSRAACGRRCGRASLALQNLPLCGTRHQVNKSPNDCERQHKRLAPLSPFLMSMPRRNPRPKPGKACTMACACGPPSPLHPPPEAGPFGGGLQAGSFSRVKTLATTFRSRLIHFINRAVTVHFLSLVNHATKRTCYPFGYFPGDGFAPGQKRNAHG